MIEPDNLPDIEPALLKLQGQPIVLDASGITLFMVFCQLQLAARHPSNKGESALIARNFAMEIQRAVCSIAPELQSICDAGWHEENDIELKDDDSDDVVRYVNLSNSRKRELLLNALALEVAVEELGRYEFGAEYWLDYLKDSAECHLELMDKEQQKFEIVKMDLKHPIRTKEVD